MTQHEEWLAKATLDEPWHRRRYAISYQWISHLAHSSARVVTLGGRSAFELMLEHVNPVQPVESLDRDLRYVSLRPNEKQLYDVVLCMEVMEHVRDREDTDIATFIGSGVMNLLRTAHDLLKPGGHLFLTTPNVCSWRNIWRLINLHHPYMYPPHHREFAMEDVVHWVKQAMPTASILRAEAVDCWSNHGCSARQVSQMHTLVKQMGGDTSYAARADDLFLLIQRTDG